MRADIVCLQEAREARDKLSRLDAFDFYERVMPQRKDDQNIILSRFAVRARGEVHFSQLASRRLQPALFADMPVDGKTLRVYNCHFGIVTVGPAAREQQLRRVIEHAAEHSGPVIICGDMNTTIPRHGLRRSMVQLFHLQPPGSVRVNGERFAGDERYAFVKVAEEWGYREATDISQSTWSIYPLKWELFKLKLDWLLVRGVETSNVVLHPYISDHKAIHADCMVN